MKLKLSRAVAPAAAIAADLARLKAASATATAEAERLGAARIAATDFDEAERLARAAERQRWLAERAANAIPALEARLAAATAEQQREVIARHFEERRRLYTKLRLAIEAAAVVQGEVIEADKRAVAELGEGTVRMNIPAIAYRGLILPDLIKMWADNLDRAFAGPRRRAAAAPRAVPPAPKAAARPVEKPAAPKPKSPRAPRHDAPPDDGQVAVFILRNGVELPDGFQCAAGDTVNVPAELGRDLVRSGAADFTATPSEE